MMSNTENHIPSGEIISHESPVLHSEFDARDIICGSDIQSICDKFKSELSGYHAINSPPVKEAVWEQILKNVLSHKCTISDTAEGDHVSGKDMIANGCGLSAKTTKMKNKKSLRVSSYRLTTVCSDSNPGVPMDILEEIQKRDSSFEFYALLNRLEYTSIGGENMIHYKMYLIPRNASFFDVSETDFKPIVGKKGKKKDTQIGWSAKNFSISFPMSSQLWISLDIDDITPYMICECTINNSLSKMSYTDVAQMMNR